MRPPRTCPTTPTTPTTALAHVPNQAFPSSHRRHSPTSRSDTPTSRSRHVLPFSQAVQAVPSNFPSKAPGNTTHQPQDFPTSPLANRPCPTRAPVPHYQGPAQTEPSTSPSRARGNAERQHQLRPFPLSRGLAPVAFRMHGLPALPIHVVTHTPSVHATPSPFVLSPSDTPSLPLSTSTPEQGTE